MFQERRDRAHSVAPVKVCVTVLAALASMAAPAAAQDCFGEGFNVCGFVWNDEDGDGVQDAGEAGIGEVKVTFFDGTDAVEFYTDEFGVYLADVPPGTWDISVLTSSIATGAQPSPANVTDDTIDSDGVDDTFGNSVIAGVVVVDTFTKQNFDFGFHTPPSVSQPGTGTPGYWKNHPEAWPVASITVGGVAYTRDQAIASLGKAGKDKTTTMFSSLVPAMLNVKIGNDDSCVATTIAAANAWMATYGPVGSGVSASSPAWSGAGEGELLHNQMDAYNNGLLCASHRR